MECRDGSEQGYCDTEGGGGGRERMTRILLECVVQLEIPTLQSTSRILLLVKRENLRGAKFTYEVKYDLKKFLSYSNADDLKTYFSEAEPDDGLHNIRRKPS